MHVAANWSKQQQAVKLLLVLIGNVLTVFWFENNTLADLDALGTKLFLDVVLKLCKHSCSLISL